MNTRTLGRQQKREQKLILILHGQDRRSRHRCSKQRRRSVREQSKQLLHTVNSQALRLCYPRSNFSVISSPHQGGHRGSLGQYFYPGFHLISNPVRLAFTLAFYTRFLTELSQPLGTVDIFSTVCHPSQTVQLPLSFFQSKAT